MYQHLTELTEGYPDDALVGGLDEVEAWEHWRVCRTIQEPGRYLDATEFARLAVIARTELASLEPKPWPLPLCTCLELRKTDGRRKLQKNRLANAKYREDDPPEPHLKTGSGDVADVAELP